MTLSALEAQAFPSSPPASRLPQRGAGLATSSSAGRDADATLEAARSFETIVMQQLLSVLRKTAPNAGMVGGAGMGGNTYVQMFDDAIAEQLSAGGGIGLTDVLTRSFGGEGQATVGTTHRTAMPFAARMAPPSAAAHGALLPGIGRRLQETAQALMDGGAAGRWGREGTLGPVDLSSQIATAEVGGEARFNVNDAQGYHGYYKCNLFALELARRAGLEVPVVGRPRGWGYPGPTRLTEDAQDDGRLEGDWARVVTGESAAALDQGAREGTRAFALVGSATEGHAGHMAVVERVHEVRYGVDGGLERIVFSGWEARENGAEHLSRRTWNRWGHPGGEMARNGFQGIEILELKAAPDGRRPEIPLSESTGPSLFDRNLSRSGPTDPMPQPEE